MWFDVSIYKVPIAMIGTLAIALEKNKTMCFRNFRGYSVASKICEFAQMNTRKL